MYCVKCGVKLAEGEQVCPLCHTPVWNPDELEKKPKYPDRLPQHYNEADIPGAVVLTVISLIIISVVISVCLGLYKKLSWGGYAVGGTILLYIIAVLPKWFRNPNPVIFVPVDHAAVALFLLYVSLVTGGNWFLSFALPVVLISCLISETVICLLKYQKKGRLFILAGFLITVGLCLVLVEFLEHITFHKAMFRWSQYAAGVLFIIGLFLLITALVRPLRRAVERRFFF